jgi:DNA replication protein DnaC
MKNINILSLVHAQSTLQEDSYKNFLSHYGIKIRNEEVNDLASLVIVLSDQTSNKNIFNQYYLGYQIPQIGKEFDLLRFGKEDIINIELKKTSTPARIQKQLQRNKYYLSFIEKKIHHFCFQADTRELFYLSDTDELKNVNFSYLIKLLEDQQIENITNIDNLFNPSNYLVSPFNSTEKFIKDEYFLTKQQETVKTEILKTIENETSASFISVTGGAGTGKTLLTYDIAKELRRIGKKGLIIHCGLLNNGQLVLNDEHDWNIIPIKDYPRHELSDYEVVIVDEAQRIYPDQLNKIVEKIQSLNGKCIFSYDKSQTLATWE